MRATLDVEVISYLCRMPQRENADIEEPAEFLLGRDITQLAAGGSHAVAVVAGYQILTLHAS